MGGRLLLLFVEGLGIKVVTRASFTVKGSWRASKSCHTGGLWSLGTTNYSFWITIDEAPPPPLQMPASPYWPDFKLCTMWPTILAPDILTGEKGQLTTKSERSDARFATLSSPHENQQRGYSSVIIFWSCCISPDGVSQGHSSTIDIDFWGVDV